MLSGGGRRGAAHKERDRCGPLGRTTAIIFSGVLATPSLQNWICLDLGLRTCAAETGPEGSGCRLSRRAGGLQGAVQPGLERD